MTYPVKLLAVVFVGIAGIVACCVGLAVCMVLVLASPIVALSARFEFNGRRI